MSEISSVLFICGFGLCLVQLQIQEIRSSRPNIEIESKARVWTVCESLTTPYSRRGDA